MSNIAEITREEESFRQIVGIDWKEDGSLLIYEIMDSDGEKGTMRTITIPPKDAMVFLSQLHGNLEEKFWHK